MIEIKQLTKIYATKSKKIVGVDHVDLTISKGEIFGIVGYSGAGKSSLLRCINLLEQPDTGSVSVDNLMLTALSKSELRKARLKIGMIFQHFHLISGKTVAGNIDFALKSAGLSHSERKQRIIELLEMVGLRDKKDVYPSQLSGGQKQRVGIARALANKPSILLCDEATSALDPTTTRSILNLLKKINQELGLTIVLITHEMEVVKEICHRIAVMQAGKIIEQGTTYDLFAHPKESLTKQFIDSILQFSIPNHVLELCKETVVDVRFIGSIAGKAVISAMLKQFSIEANFLHGKIEYIQGQPIGIFIMELTGEQTEIEAALLYLTEQTNHVEVIKHGTR